MLPFYKTDTEKVKERRATVSDEPMNFDTGEPGRRLLLHVGMRMIEALWTGVVILAEVRDILLELEQPVLMRPGDPFAVPLAVAPDLAPKEQIPIPVHPPAAPDKPPVKQTPMQVAKPGPGKVGPPNKWGR